MNNFKPVYKGQLEMASIRLVKDAPIMSENEIHNAGDAVKLLGEYLCEMDREVLCIINVRPDDCTAKRVAENGNFVKCRRYDYHA